MGVLASKCPWPSGQGSLQTGLGGACAKAPLLALGWSPSSVAGAFCGLVRLRGAGRGVRWSPGRGARQSATPARGRIPAFWLWDALGPPWSPLAFRPPSACTRTVVLVGVLPCARPQDAPGSPGARSAGGWAALVPLGLLAGLPCSTAGQRQAGLRVALSARRGVGFGGEGGARGFWGGVQNHGGAPPAGEKVLGLAPPESRENAGVLEKSEGVRKFVVGNSMFTKHNGFHRSTNRRRERTR